MTQDAFAFTALDEATGQILYSGIAHDVNSLTQDGVRLWSGLPDPGSEYLDASNAWQKRPPAPTPRDAWDWATKTWSDTRPLEQVKSDCWAAIRAQRDAAIDTPKMTSVGTFDADLKAQTNLASVIHLTQLAISRGGADSVNFTLATNVRQGFTLEQLQTAALEIGSRVQAIFDSAAAARSQIEAATTAEQALAVTWSPPN